MNMTDKFENVTVSIRANIYEEGKCQSRTILFSDGTKKTLGVYLPGNFVFDSDEPERVLITSGVVEVLFPGDKDWRKISVGETYDVPAECTFKVRCDEISEYICDFLKS